MRRTLRALEVLSILELVSIAALLTNLATIHLRPITTILGPVHGAFYLAVLMTALFAWGLHLRTRLWALVPVLGGVATLINVRWEGRSAAARQRNASVEAEGPMSAPARTDS